MLNKHTIETTNNAGERRAKVATRLPLVACLLLAGCGASPLTPTPPAPDPLPAPIAFTGHLVLAGQSNAVNVAPILSTYGSVSTSAHKSLSISYWSATDPGVTMWRDLQPFLHEPMRAFVWWQGESDATTPTYQADLVELLERVRAEAGPVPILIVRVLAKPPYANVRTAQANAVAILGNARLVSIDGCDRDGESDHLTAEGYRCAAGMIIAGLP